MVIIGVDGRSYYSINLRCGSPPDDRLGLKVDLRVKRGCLLEFKDKRGINSHYTGSGLDSQFINLPTLHLPDRTMNHTRSALHQWVQLHPALQGRDDAINYVTDQVIEHVFHNNEKNNLLAPIIHVEVDLYHSLHEVFDQEVSERDSNREYFFKLLEVYKFITEFPGITTEVCSICLDDLVSAAGENKKKKNDVFELPCRHVFHDECIKKWLGNLRGSCPLCRINVCSEIKHFFAKNLRMVCRRKYVPKSRLSSIRIP